MSLWVPPFPRLFNQCGVGVGKIGGNPQFQGCADRHVLFVMLCQLSHGNVVKGPPALSRYGLIWK